MPAALDVNPVSERRHSRDVADAAVVAWSLLRLGTDTRVPAAFKALTQSADLAEPSAWTDPALLERLADLAAIRQDVRNRRIALARERAGAAVSRGLKAGLSIVPWFRADYPPLLREIPDPPILLWTLGDLSALARPAVAVVGSRRATPAGLTVARSLSRGLADAGIAVVSGMARGVDGAAHEGALEAGGRTVAVLGTGADVVYPREHADLRDRISRSGIVMSEYPPGMPPFAGHFPLRNRIISGLSSAVVVIEASERSGSLITARLALEQGREVLAVPGSVSSGRYAGCHALIKDGAALVETVEDVFHALGWVRSAPRERALDVNRHELSMLERVMALGEAYTPDALVGETGLSVSRLLAELSRLEMSGSVERVPGGGFVRIDKSAIGGGNG
jgi:DNA processing protein